MNLCSSRFVTIYRYETHSRDEDRINANTVIISRRTYLKVHEKLIKPVVKCDRKRHIVTDRRIEAVIMRL